MIEDNLIEYDDSQIYDLENDVDEEEVQFFLELAREAGDPVLELGCGTGRLTIPLAQAGVDITGIEIIPGMLALAKQKAGELPIRWVQADVREFCLERSFRLIFESGCVFQHMLTRPDQEAFLARVHEHLDDEGRFVFGSIFPSLKQLENVDVEKEWFTTQHPDGREIRVSGTECYDALRQIKIETAYRRWIDASGKEVLKVAPLSLRYNFPQELETLLHYNGFTIEERYGSNDRSPLTDESRLMICICRKRK